LGSNKGGITWEIQDNVGKTTRATLFSYTSYVTIVSVIRIGKMTVREQASSLVHTLWAIAGTGYPFRIHITAAHPFCFWDDQADIQHQDAKKEVSEYLYYGIMFQRLLVKVESWDLGFPYRPFLTRFIRAGHTHLLRKDTITICRVQAISSASAHH